ncbi:MAG TPA: UDP binding domain-containing protein, partial [Saprospiraceae bacterium]|nr:UDP binding domain-containing protein [Saprospiraceae bacterium]
ILFDKLYNFYKGNLNGKTIAIWGLSFKPNTDDIREAPALYIIDKLLDAGAKIRVFDPEAMDNVRRIYGEKLFYAVDQYEVLSDCDALMIMTEWNEFRSPQFDSMFHSIKDKVIFDGRNIFDPKEMQEKGFNYESIGRPV